MRIEKYGCSFEVNDNPSYINFWKSHFEKDWEVDTFQFLSRHLDGNKTFLDIGSWIGPIALPAALCSKQVICFEPDTVAYTELKKNIDINNFSNVLLEQKGVSIHKTIKLGADELGESITRDSCDNNAFDVDCVSIEEIFSKYNLTQEDVSIVKIDIEGHEAELLQDPFLMKLNVPMHVSLHYPFAADKNAFTEKIRPFFKSKNIDVATFDTTRNISIEIE